MNKTKNGLDEPIKLPVVKYPFFIYNIDTYTCNIESIKSCIVMKISTCIGGDYFGAAVYKL